jgi:hypothetical protein
MPKAKLRQDNIRCLEYVGAAHGKAQFIYWDMALPGFGLRKFPNGAAATSALTGFKSESVSLI